MNELVVQLWSAYGRSKVTKFDKMYIEKAHLLLNEKPKHVFER